MNDLKAYTHVSEELDAETGKYALYAYDVDGNRTPVDETELVYLKSDVDEAIAELEESHKKEVGQLLIEIAKLKQKNDDYRYTIAVLRKDRSRQKYKRCVQLADSCAFRAVVAKMENRRFPTRKNSWQMFIYPKWYKRWLAIADKFKE